MKIAVGTDHAGLDMKSHISKLLEARGHEVVDKGTYTTESTDYPLYGKAVGRAVVSGEADLGVVICGTGIGISLAANKVPGVRAANCTNSYMATMARAHNNANVLALGDRVDSSCWIIAVYVAPSARISPCCCHNVCHNRNDILRLDFRFCGRACWSTSTKSLASQDH